MISSDSRYESIRSRFAAQNAVNQLAKIAEPLAYLQPTRCYSKKLLRLSSVTDIETQ
jgi:hypothetical protein